MKRDEFYSMDYEGKVVVVEKLWAKFMARYAFNDKKMDKMLNSNDAFFAYSGKQCTEEVVDKFYKDLKRAGFHYN